MRFQLTSSFLIVVLVSVTLAEQQQKVYTFESSSKEYYSGKEDQNESQKSTGQVYPINKSYYENQQQQQQQAPIRWRFNEKNDNQNDQMNRVVVKSNFNSNRQQTRSYVSDSDTDNHIETKHEELRQRTIRMRNLSGQQNAIRQQLETNETMLREEMKANNMANVDNIRSLISSILDCVKKFDRVQNMLQKLYRDQIFEEKALLQLYKISRPNDQILHNQLSEAINRWELIYNQLLEMQLSERRKNDQREREFDNLLRELKAVQETTPNYTASLSKSPSYYSASLSRPSLTASTQSFESHNTDTHNAMQRPASISTSYSSSYESTSNNTHSTYSSNTKSSGSNQPTYYYSSSGVNEKTNGKTQNHRTSDQEIMTIRPDLEVNSLRFRRPESSSLKEIKCLDRWYQDLAIEDDEWIAKHQAKNEEMFRELIKMQKLQWDNLQREHDKKNSENIPQNFECQLETQALCDEEERNFKRKFNEYRVSRWPSNIDNQQSNQQVNLNNDQQQQSQQSMQTVVNNQNINNQQRQQKKF